MDLNIAFSSIRGVCKDNAIEFHEMQEVQEIQIDKGFCM